MKKEEVCRKMLCAFGAGKRTLIYSIITTESDEFQCLQYGVSVKVQEDGEESSVYGVTSVREKAEELIDLIATNFVTPVSLRDVVYDWLP